MALREVLPAVDRAGWPWHGTVLASPEALLSGGRPWPRLSIVMPSYNQGAFVEAALRSVLLQGYPNLELIVIDGGSEDRSADVIAKYAPWLTRFVSERDRGPAHALNKGFALASGEILGFLNADDFYMPGALTRVAKELLRRPSIDILSGHGYHARVSGEIGPPIFSDPWHPTRFLYGTCVLVQQATFFRRRIFERIHGFNEDRRTCWDMELWADMARAGASFHVFDEFLAAFRLHDRSFTGDARFTGQTRQDTGEILDAVRGRPEMSVDRVLRVLHRIRKFSVHPLRTLRQRWFFHDTLGRWSL